MNDRPVTPVKSAQRVLELLEYFADEQRALTVKEISVGLGYPQSSTSVLLRSLTDSGYFDHDARTGLYSPNLRLTLATAWIEEHMFNEQGLMRLMHRVHDACGHTVMVGKLQGAQVRYLHVLQATRPDRFVAKIGSLRPLPLSARGRMLLTTRTEREVAVLLRRANALETDPARRVTLEAALAGRAGAAPGLGHVPRGIDRRGLGPGHSAAGAAPPRPDDPEPGRPGGRHQRRPGRPAGIADRCRGGAARSGQPLSPRTPTGRCEGPGQSA